MERRRSARRLDIELAQQKERDQARIFDQVLSKRSGHSRSTHNSSQYDDEYDDDDNAEDEPRHHPSAQLKECAALFGKHYGVWGPKGHKPGERVKLGAQRLKDQCLFNSNCSVALAKTQSRQLVGHAFVCRFPWGDGFASWITQLVVAADEKRPRDCFAFVLLRFGPSRHSFRARFIAPIRCEGFGASKGQEVYPKLHFTTCSKLGCCFWYTICEGLPSSDRRRPSNN